MPQRAAYNKGHRLIAVFAMLLFAALTMAAGGPHPLDAVRHASASSYPAVSAPSPPTPLFLLCDWAVHSHVVIAAPPSVIAPPPPTELPAVCASSEPVPNLGRRPTGRGPPVRFT
jgi:hypothetical protein